jgi:hypothetical protein
VRHASALAAEIPALSELLERLNIKDIKIVERVRGAPADAGVELELADDSKLFALLEVKVASLPRSWTLMSGDRRSKYAAVLNGEMRRPFGLIERVGGVGVSMCTAPSHLGSGPAAITAGADVAVWLRCSAFPSLLGGSATAGPSGAGPSDPGELPKTPRAQASSPRGSSGSGGRAPPSGGGPGGAGPSGN